MYTSISSNLGSSSCSRLSFVLLSFVLLGAIVLLSGCDTTNVSDAKTNRLVYAGQPHVATQGVFMAVDSRNQLTISGLAAESVCIDTRGFARADIHHRSVVLAEGGRFTSEFVGTLGREEKVLARVVMQDVQPDEAGLGKQMIVDFDGLGATAFTAEYYNHGQLLGTTRHDVVARGGTTLGTSSDAGKSIHYEVDRDGNIHIIIDEDEDTTVTPPPQENPPPPTDDDPPPVPRIPTIKPEGFAEAIPYTHVVLTPEWPAQRNTPVSIHAIRLTGHGLGDLTIVRERFLRSTESAQTHHVWEKPTPKPDTR